MSDTITANGAASAPESAEEILSLLREQAALYDRLESYSRRQRALVTQEDVGPLLALLAERQKLSQQLTDIARRLAPVRHEWSVYRQRFTREQRDEAERLIDEAGRRLQRVIDEDESDARVLSGRKQQVAASMRSSHSTSQAMSAYRHPAAEHGGERLNCMDEEAS